mmetsp:Transcript_19630/g.34745  ORF Transcript_19630/g.34745 Transcript_19630/m.34745 type:complete len:96 (+) Transcript_19630:818-1105(+)
MIGWNCASLFVACTPWVEVVKYMVWKVEGYSSSAFPKPTNLMPVLVTGSLMMACEAHCSSSAYFPCSMDLKEKGTAMHAKIVQKQQHKQPHALKT